MTSGGVATIVPMRVGVVDVGSNTVRLLVAARRSRCVEPLLEQRAYLRLGDEIERLGWISDAKLRETVDCVRRYAEAAGELGVHQLEVVVTAPGRRASNGDELVGALAEGAAANVRVLAAEEEAELAFRGALSCLERVPDSLAVCDSGGGSTELVVGNAAGPQWVRSVDVGSLTVRRMLPDDPPGKRAVALAREEVRERLSGLTPPLPKKAYATGGTARALRRINGRTFGEKELEAALKRLARSSSSELAREFGLDVERAWTLVGGAVVLAEVQLRLGVPFEVSRAGMREGVAATTLAELAAA
jgi:exopolyphosphatase/guanosine-5'-triphosphate,3'-diphosphate pyrophosphatase